MGIDGEYPLKMYYVGSGWPKLQSMRRMGRGVGGGATRRGCAHSAGQGSPVVTPGISDPTVSQGP